MVAVFARATVFADKNPLFKFRLLTMTTTATGLRSRLPTVYLYKQLIFQVAQVLNHWEKNRKTKVANLATPASNQFPSSLLERDAVVLLDLLEARSTHFKLRLALLVLEKPLVRIVQTFNDLLNCLTAYHLPMLAIWMQLAKLGNSLLQVVFRYVFKTRFVCKSLSRNALIPDNSSNIYRLVQLAIIAMAIKPILQRLANYHRNKNTPLLYLKCDQQTATECLHTSLIAYRPQSRL